MISVIIPLMNIPPYDQQIFKCIKNIHKQTADIEILLREHGIQDYIEKNKLLNEGIKDSKGDILWFCDADFILPDVDLLKRMETKLKTDTMDVIYPMFYSPVYKGYKIADGAAFIKKSILTKFGKLDESLTGIGGVTFDLLNWCMDNTNFHCSPEFLIRLNYFPFVKHKNKQSETMADKTRDIYVEVKNKLIKRGLWPE